MKESIKAISEFLGCSPIDEGVVDPLNNKFFRYEGEKLIYDIWVNFEDKYISVSGDHEDPFCYKSLFEISAEFDRIQIETEPEFYKDQKILVCRKDYKNFNNFKTLMIMKWNNSELSIWPNLISSNEIKIESNK